MKKFIALLVVILSMNPMQGMDTEAEEKREKNEKVESLNLESNLRSSSSSEAETGTVSAEFMESLQEDFSLQSLVRTTQVYPNIGNYLSDCPVRFYQNDYSLKEEYEQKLSNLLNLIDGYEEPGELQAVSRFSAWARAIRPQIQIAPEVVSGLDNMCKKSFLQIKKEFKGQPDKALESNVQRVWGRLSEPPVSFELSKIVSNEENVGEESKVIIPLPVKIRGSTIGFCPQDQHVYVGCADGKIYVYDIQSHKLLRILEGHNKCNNWS